MGKNYSNQAGKGDRPRPVNKKQFNLNFDKISFESKKDTIAKQVKTKNGKTTYTY